MQIIIDQDGIVEYLPHFISTLASRNYFEQLESEIKWQADEIFLFGKRIITNRKVAWYGDKAYEYIYSNHKKVALPWTNTLKHIKHELEQFTGEQFNSCLLNYYHNGSEGMGWHNDNESTMKKNAAIASISLGAERKFCFKHILTQETQSIMLEDGSLLMMKDSLQQFWKHSLPITKRIKEPRINLTFRQFVPPLNIAN